MNRTARVAIIMPVYNEARNLPRLLASLQEQTFDRARMRLIAVDGASSDGSAAIIRGWLESQQFEGRVLSNPLRKIPISLNIAIAQTDDDEIVLRVDAHTILGPTYVADAVAALDAAAADVVCVGAAAQPVAGDTFAQRVVEALYTNPMGLGSSGLRNSRVRAVDSVYLGVWRPGVLTRAAGYNEQMEANEDGELAARIRKDGFSILHVPLPCRFLVHRGIFASIRQWNRYGYWRAKMLRRHPDSIRLRHLAPPIAALLVAGMAASPLRVLLVPLFLIYAIAVFWGRAPGESPAITLVTLAFFPALQVAFVAGMLAGLLTEGVEAWPRSEAAQIRS